MSERSEFGRDPAWSSDGGLEGQTELNDFEDFEKSRVVFNSRAKVILRYMPQNRGKTTDDFTEEEAETAAAMLRVQSGALFDLIRERNASSFDSSMEDSGIIRWNASTPQLVVNDCIEFLPIGKIIVDANLSLALPSGKQPTLIESKAFFLTLLERAQYGASPFPGMKAEVCNGEMRDVKLTLLKNE